MNNPGTDNFIVLRIKHQSLKFPATFYINLTKNSQGIVSFVN